MAPADKRKRQISRRGAAHRRDQPRKQLHHHRLTLEPNLRTFFEKMNAVFLTFIRAQRDQTGVPTAPMSPIIGHLLRL